MEIDDEILDDLSGVENWCICGDPISACWNDGRCAELPPVVLSGDELDEREDSQRLRVDA